MIWLISIIAFLTVILFTALGFWLHHEIFPNIDDPSKACIFVAGKTKPYRGKLIGKTDKGITFSYRWGKIIIPANYSEHYHYHRRAIWLSQSNRVIPSPYDDDSALAIEEKSDLIQSVIDTNIGKEAINAIRGKDSLSIILIICIIAALVFGVGGGYIYGKKSVQGVSSNITESSPVQSSVIIQQAGGSPQ